MNDFIALFGDYSISTALIFCSAIGFVYGTYTKVRKKLITDYEAKKKQEDMLQKTFNTVKTLKNEIEKLNIQQNTFAERLEKMDKQNRERELNKIKDRLLQSYRYYTSIEKNPLQAWTRMEAQSFWDLFKEYEKLGGNGYMHSEVQPEMNKLEIIEMDDVEKLRKLFEHRK